MSASDLRTFDLTRDDIVDEDAFMQSIADSYRQCALAGADMRVVADSIESVRQARSRLTVAYPTWREFDDQIGRCQNAPLQKQLVRLRQEYRAQLEQATSAWARSQSFPAWIERLGMTFRAWRIPLCAALAAAAPPAPSDADTRAVALLPQALRYMLIDAWDQTRPTFEWLANHASVRPRDRAFSQARLAQIDLLFGGDIDGALARIERAAAISDEVPVRADVECVRGQCYRARAEQTLVEHGRTSPDAMKKARAQRTLATSALENSSTLDSASAEPLYYRGDLALDEGDLSTAESYYRHAISAHPGEVASHVRLFKLLMRLKRYDEVGAVVERAVAVDEEAAADTLATSADAYREDGDLPTAFEYAERAVRRDPNRGKCYYTRGQIRLARQEYALAVDDFRKAVGLEPTTYATKDWRWDFVGEPEAESVLLGALSNTPRDPVIRQALAGLVTRWHGDAGRVNDALAVLDALQRTAEDSERAEIGNARGDVHYYTGNHAAAASAFADAWRLDRSRIVYGTNLVAALRGQRSWAEAERAVEDVFAASKDEAWRKRELASTANGRANDLFSVADYSSAAASYERAAGLQPDEPVYWSNLALAYTNQIEANTDTDNAVALLAPASAALGRALQLQPDQAEYRQRLATVDALRQGTGRYGPRFLRRAKAPHVLRVAVAANLVECIAPDRDERLAPGLQTSIETMRRGLRDTYGTEVPGVRFRDDTTLASDSYVIELFDTVVSMGAVSPSQQLLVGTEAIGRAAAAGITGKPGVSPLNGESGMWLAGPARDRAVALGLAPWSVMDYVVYDIAYQIIRRLKDLVGHDEALALLRSSAPSRADAFERDGVLLTRLVRVLRALLAERVSIAAIDDIAALVSDQAVRVLSDSELVARARLIGPVRASLPGRQAGAVRLALPAAHAQTVARGIVTLGAEPVLAIAPDQCGDFLVDIRNTVASTPSLSALVVDDASIRPFVRRVIESEFPQLWVLSQAECAELPDAEAGAPKAAASAL